MKNNKLKDYMVMTKITAYVNVPVRAVDLNSAVEVSKTLEYSDILNLDTSTELSDAELEVEGLFRV